MKEIDPKRVSPHLVYIGCHLELRQLARAGLRQRFEPEGDIDEAAEAELFPDLQWRYPVARSRSYEEPEYVLLGDMTDDDVEFNLRRLRMEAEAKLKHADALEEWWKDRRRRA